MKYNLLEVMMWRNTLPSSLFKFLTDTQYPDQTLATWKANSRTIFSFLYQYALLHMDYVLKQIVHFEVCGQWCISHLEQ
jgi:hypothetical protein